MSHSKEAAAPSLVDLTCAACGIGFQRARWEVPKAGRRPACSRRCAARLGKGLTGRRATLLRVNGWAFYGNYLGRYDRASGRQVLQHREVMEQHLGRQLRSDEHVDHINGNTVDNRVENLRVLTPSEHSRKTQLNVRRRRAIAELELIELATYRRIYGPLFPDFSELSGAGDV